MNLEICELHVRALMRDVADSPVAIYPRALTAWACCRRALSHSAGLLQLFECF
jgi:hypothetical protein